MIEITENKLVVPKGIRFISEWREYSLNQFQFPHILDKKIPGCGYTEYCLTNNLPIVLISPRLFLLENKVMQHPDNIFYFKVSGSKDPNSDKDIITMKKSGKVVTLSNNNIEIKDSISEIFNKLVDYLNFCYIKQKSPKILVTYDSFHYVKEYLEKHKLLDTFYVVVDEFQSIFTDSRFKPDTELGFVKDLQGVQNVCYVSATPMMDKYLKMVDEFKDLPYFELDWESKDTTRVIRPDLSVHTSRSIISSAKPIIESYKNSNFLKAVVVNNDKEDEIIESKEAVMFVNSVSNILSIIKGCDLKPEECNILCAKTPENLNKIKKKLGKNWEIGTVPLKGEVHKMFTFCTRTVYLGADFYSTNARTFIFSDANIETLAVDITLDLPQILGRQRLNENPWKNRAELYYKTLGKENELTQEAFDEFINNKLRISDDLLMSYKSTPDKAKNSLAYVLKRDAINTNYKDNYVSVNEVNNNLVPCFNNLVLVAEQRAFEIQQIDYKDRFAVFNTMVNNNILNKDLIVNISKFLLEFNNLPTFVLKMKTICENQLNQEELMVILDQVPLIYKNYYLALGPERCKALSYQQHELEQEFNNLLINRSNILTTEINNNFEVGKKYTKVEIKNKLAKIFVSVDYNKTAKASILADYFDLKACKIKNENGEWNNGFEILGKK